MRSTDFFTLHYHVYNTIVNSFLIQRFESCVRGNLITLINSCGIYNPIQTIYMVCTLKQFHYVLHLTTTVLAKTIYCNNHEC